MFAAKLFSMAAAILSVSVAHAVVIEGTVTDPLGKPIANARVQLVQGKGVVGFAFTDYDGTYEIRSTLSGRFLMLVAAVPYSPSIGTDFYASTTSTVVRDVALEYMFITQQTSVTSSGIPTPVAQVPGRVELVPQAAMATEINLTSRLRLMPGVQVVQTGQYGGPVALSIRGGSGDDNKVLIDGIPATDIGGRFDLSGVSTTSLAPPEIYRGTNSALYGTGAEAGVLALATARGKELRPAIDYTGDAGNFHTYRNEAVLSGALNRLDYLAGWSRFNTSNALPLDEYHLTTATADIGYSIFTDTLVRFTLRDGLAASGLPGPHDIYGISSSGKRGEQDLYSGLTVDNTLANNWHNVVRYGIARRREQVEQFAPTGEPVTTITDGVPTTRYFGDPVTLRGANGYTTTGQAAFFLPAYDSVNNRNELAWQSSYNLPLRIATAFDFHYEDERGRLTPGLPFEDSAQRTNFQYGLQFQGDIYHKLFYSLGGSILRNHLFGTAGMERFGLTYSMIPQSDRFFQGTILRANFATGVQEPSIPAELTSLSTLLEETGNAAAIAAHGISPITAERSRTWSLGVDQSILGPKLVLKADLFHNVFDHQIEELDANGLEQLFDLPPALAEGLPSAAVNSLAYRAQGLEIRARYQPIAHLVIDGGYTYLDSLVLDSFSGVAAAGTYVDNPMFPGIPIGALSPLVGNSMFRRAPNTGFFNIQYSGTKWSTSLVGAIVGRSDDSTYQLGTDRNGGNTLLLPNQNLDFGYQKLDMNILYRATSHFTVFTQLDNLVSEQHMGPIGYPGLPFTFRAGMKIRIGGS